MQTNKFSSDIENFYSLCRNPPLKIMEFFVILGSYDRGFYGNIIIKQKMNFLSFELSNANKFICKSSMHMSEYMRLINKHNNLNYREIL